MHGQLVLSSRRWHPSCRLSRESLSASGFKGALELKVVSFGLTGRCYPSLRRASLKSPSVAAQHRRRRPRPPDATRFRTHSALCSVHPSFPPSTRAPEGTAPFANTHPHSRYAGPNASTIVSSESADGVKPFDYLQLGHGWEISPASETWPAFGGVAEGRSRSVGERERLQSRQR